MSELIQTDRQFSESQLRLLRILAVAMIPADGVMPSAADDRIFDEIIAGFASRQDVIVRGLAQLDELSLQLHRKSFADLDEGNRMSVVERLRSGALSFVQLFESVVIACYYRDDRVLESLGLPARAPFPHGYTVAATDWSLLDPVRRRQPFFRTP